jgi:hypothetical protein
VNRQPEPSLLFLVLASIGLLPVPFLPAWVGVSLFGTGGVGMVVGLGYGIMLGSVLVKALKEWQLSRKENTTFSVLGMIGLSAIMISQIVISLRLGLIPDSQDAFSTPVMVWISLLGFIPVLILGNQLPIWSGTKLTASGLKVSQWVENRLVGVVRFFDRLVEFISDVFEGQGGLIWALLIGLLLISLIGWGGG